MSTRRPGWHQANQRLLLAALARVGEALDRHAASRGGGAPVLTAGSGAVDEARREMPSPAALDLLVEAFGLSPFERDVLLLCAGIELDGSFPTRCGTAAGDARRGVPTFGLALAALADPHWSALSPSGPLRRYRLVELEPGDGLTQGRLRIDERVLHYLAGVPSLDSRLWGLFEPLAVDEAEALPPSHRATAARLASLWARRAWSTVQLTGADAPAKLTVAARAGADVGLVVHLLRAADVPTGAPERETLARLWEREAVLCGSALLLDCDDGDHGEALRGAAAFVERVPGIVVIASREPLRLRRRSALRLEVPRPSATEQEAAWRGALALDETAADQALAGVVSQFSLGVPAIRAAAAEVKERLTEGGAPPLPALVWETCRGQARPRLDDLAARIEPSARWEDLVLPEAEMRLLRDLAAHVRQRAKVYERWGFAHRDSRGLGITALFAGMSGTGKTMAAEVLAGELALDLYRIDLSQVVSKYIGETEKNLRRIFDAAEEGGAILLFDEADALFGKRSEVKDSHDRYANLEVSYLLQRMEAYRGLAILTTNLRSALDTAFLRRLRFIVEFPFPDSAQRIEIWRRIFPAATPTVALDLACLARLHVPGGVIRNIAMNAAFLAADDGDAVTMRHLRHAAEAEYVKLERPLTEAELGGWT